eukprot:scaffold2259_cov180-Amphora_coffeaeformis.AAC.2
MATEQKGCINSNVSAMDMANCSMVWLADHCAARERVLMYNNGGGIELRYGTIPYQYGMVLHRSRNNK